MAQRVFVASSATQSWKLDCAIKHLFLGAAGALVWSSFGSTVLAVKSGSRRLKK